MKGSRQCMYLSASLQNWPIKDNEDVEFVFKSDSRY